MIVRSHLPWPLRWAFVALMMGFSAAIALWAFEFGKSIAGIEGHSKEELMSKLMFLLNAPAQRIASALNALPRNLAVTVNEAIKANKFAS